MRTKQIRKNQTKLKHNFRGLKRDKLGDSGYIHFKGISVSLSLSFSVCPSLLPPDLTLFLFLCLSVSLDLPPSLTPILMSALLPSPSFSFFLSLSDYLSSLPPTRLPFYPPSLSLSLSVCVSPPSLPYFLSLLHSPFSSLKIKYIIDGLLYQHSSILRVHFTHLLKVASSHLFAVLSIEPEDQTKTTKIS